MTFSRLAAVQSWIPSFYSSMKFFLSRGERRWFTLFPEKRRWFTLFFMAILSFHRETSMVYSILRGDSFFPQRNVDGLLYSLFPERKVDGLLYSSWRFFLSTKESSWFTFRNIKMLFFIKVKTSNSLHLLLLWKPTSNDSFVLYLP